VYKYTNEYRMNPNDPKITIPPPTKPLRHIIKYRPNSNNKYSEYNLNENNQWHGLHEVWHRNGQLWIRRNYQNGLLHGLYEEWYPDGSLCFRYYFQ
jgi:antitoxin component YwqK of YwqJK toxin-antitoxin module